VLGAAWSILEPAVHFALYLLVFEVLLGTRLAVQDGVGPFGLYLVAGLVPFLAFQETLVTAVGLAREHAHLIRHVAVPVEALVCGSLLAVLLRQGVALAVVVAVCAAWGSISLVHLPLVVAGLLLLVIGAWGAALLLVPVGAYLPDAAHGVSVGCTVLFFLTPIVYREGVVPAVMQPIFAVNPLVGALELIRAGLLGGQVSPAHAGVTALAAVIAATCGAWFFRRRVAALRDVV
jgi:lipopolysaccharide transport system permease protein